MRRILLTVFASSLLALAVPAVASAHHARHHARRARAHHRHHVRTVTFAPAAHSTTTPATTPAPSGEGETVGTIASYEGGVLTIMLADKTTVSGKVTEMTHIDCGCAGHEGSGGEDPWQHGGEGPWQQGGDNQGSDGHGGSGGEQSDFRPSSDPGSPGSSGCGTEALVPGAVVKEAELRLGSEGAVWESVELAHS